MATRISPNDLRRHRSYRGHPAGDFAKVVLPEGDTGRWVGSTYYLSIPKPVTPEELRKRKEEAQIRKDLALTEDDGPPPLEP